MFTSFLTNIFSHTVAPAGLVATSLLGWMFGSATTTPAIPAPIEYRINTTPQYTLINPLIFIDTDQRLYPEFNDFDTKINNYIQNVEASGTISSVSVYLRDVNSGHWTGINENDLYEPGSMLKVAVLIAYERYAMDEATLNKTTVNEVLSQQLYYPGSNQTGQFYLSDTDHLAPGMHTMQELLNHMIIDSDNSALQVLMTAEPNEFQSVYADFRLPPTPTVQDGDFMSAKSFSVIFRSLYNASYLSRSASEKVLQLLTQTTFNDGIVSGVSSSTIKIAHKFGERAYETQSGVVLSRELHDCGIVYYPGHPYLICIMTKGLTDYPTLAHVLSDVSKMAYSYIDATAQKNAIMTQ